MNKRDVFLVIVIAAAVGVISSVVTSNVMLGPPGGFGSSIVKNAHQCNADDVCEVDSLLVENMIELRDSGDLETPIINIWALRDLYSGSVIFEKAYAEGFWIDYIFDGRVRISGLEGEGTSYVCVNEQGSLLRSDIPC